MRLVLRIVPELFIRSGCSETCGASLDRGPEGNEFCSSDHCLHEVVGARFFVPACISSAVAALCPVPI